MLNPGLLSGSVVAWDDLTPLRLKNYCVKFSLMLFYEELQLEYNIRVFDLKVGVASELRNDLFSNLVLARPKATRKYFSSPLPWNQMGLEGSVLPEKTSC